MNDYESINLELRRALRLYVQGLTTRAAVERLTVEAREALIRETESWEGDKRRSVGR